MPYWAQDGVHEIYRDWHDVLAEYDGDRALCAEAWLPTPEQTALWVRPDEMHQAFNFAYLETGWDAAALRAVIDESLRGLRRRRRSEHVGALEPRRRAPRVAARADRREPAGPRHRPELAGQARSPTSACAAPAPRRRVMLALPGSAYLYQGEELGLPEVIDLADDARQDPTWFRTGGERYGRDGCRVPIPWSADAPAYGFSPTGASWLPQPAEWATLARDAQVDGPGIDPLALPDAPRRPPRTRSRRRDARVARRPRRGRRRIPQRECDGHREPRRRSRSRSRTVS